MYKNIQQQKEREKFIKQCIDNPDAGAKKLRNIEKRLKKANGTMEVVSILQDVTFLSERSILYEYQK